MKRNIINNITIIAFIIGATILLSIPVHATITGAGCADKCSFNCNCGPLCGGGGCSYQNGKECCPVCYIPSCESVGMHTGGCPAGCKNCKTKVLKCACGNDTRECNSCEGEFKPPPGPKPTDEPPIPTEPPPTPTPIQPTALIHIPLPAADKFEGTNMSGAGKTSQDDRDTAGKRWVCIQSLPCSDDASNCSAWGNKEHRVLIKTKEGTRLILEDYPTYVFECLTADPPGQETSYQCTTGDDVLDNQLIFKSNLPHLRNAFGYEFVSYTTQNNDSINQSRPEEVRRTESDGTFGPYEWESITTQNVWRYIMTAQDIGGSSADQGNMGALQQADFSFSSGNYAKDCVIISWDPKGIIYDIDTLNPLKDAKVTLYVKNKKGQFEVMEDKKWGILANPIQSTQNGTYQFYVPAGTYKIVVEKKGFNLVTDVHSIPSHATITNIYNGGEIVTEGEIKEVNILMKRTSWLDRLATITSSFFSYGK